ncbi:MAG: ABC transporter ATP-binding protein, partial [Pseudomonadota bacterium]|nr:ABC transporter ATP-binding protein [Pseudomonadota bacterium]
LKELIDWDQQRLDVQVKYDQVVQNFSPERLLPIEEALAAPPDLRLAGPLVVEDLRVPDPHGGTILDGVSFRLEEASRVALISDGGPAASILAQILARRTDQYSGRIMLGDHDLAQLPAIAVGRHLSYAGVEPVLFPGSIRDNLVYGLRHRALEPANEGDRHTARRIAEALRTGNPVESVQDRWIDFELTGARDEEELDAILLDLLRSVGMRDDLYRFGLSGMVDPARQPELAEQIVEARARLRETFHAAGMADLVEPFDAERYNSQATVAENLLFGVPTSRALMGRSLAEHAGFRETLDREGLSADLIEMGARIAETMTEIFRGLPPGHSLFEQFSFIGADELAEFEAILRRRSGRGLSKDDGLRLLSLPLAYVEPRHRLGLLDDALKARLVAARRPVREMLERSGDPGVHFYDAERVTPAAPLKDNLLFGRASYSAANAQARVTEAMSAVVTEMGLRDAIERIGLDHQVGPAGRLLTAQQRASVSLVRCLVKRPDVLIVDGALAPYDESRARDLQRLLLDASKERALFIVLPNDRQAGDFDAVVRFEGGRVSVEPSAATSASDEAPRRVAGAVA